MSEEEDKWWSPGHVDTEDDDTPQKNTTDDSSKEEIVGRENIDNFIDQIRDPESRSKEPESVVITAREDGSLALSLQWLAGAEDSLDYGG